MIFQLKTAFPGRADMIKTMLEHIERNKITGFVKGDMKLQELDPFFLNLIREHKLGTKIIEPRIHFMMPGTDHKAGHNHNEITGVYYLQAPKNSGNLIFPNKDIEIEPEPGLFVVVPGKETHAISENKSNDIRIALAFCIQ